MDWGAWKPITTVCKTTNGNVLTQRTPIRLCNNLEGWEGWEVGGRFQTEGTSVHLWLMHAAVWQKSNQYCKAIINQLKINKYNFFKFLIRLFQMMFTLDYYCKYYVELTLYNICSKLLNHSI